MIGAWWRNQTWDSGKECGLSLEGSWEPAVLTRGLVAWQRAEHTQRPRSSKQQDTFGEPPETLRGWRNGGVWGVTGDDGREVDGDGNNKVWSLKIILKASGSQ